MASIFEFVAYRLSLELKILVSLVDGNVSTISMIISIRICDGRFCCVKGDGTNRIIGLLTNVAQKYLGGTEIPL